MIDIQKWATDGYYLLPEFYSCAEIDRVLAEQRAAWDERRPRIVADDLVTGHRLRIQDVPEHDRTEHRFKVNDLYLESPIIRSLAINSRLTPILKKLLGHAPVICNSLSFDKGSSQPDHVDALYMTPRTDGHLIAIWVGLEDCSPDAGPLRYYPGSNKIAPYLFSTGSIHCVDSEMEAWQTYMDYEVQRLKLSPVTFPARKGDVFIWSAYLLHGGAPIRDPALTRRSLVFHYYSDVDAQHLPGTRVIAENGGHWLYRPHQPVNGKLGELPVLQ